MLEMEMKLEGRNKYEDILLAQQNDFLTVFTEYFERIGFILKKTCIFEP
jgi:hypothetical protein